MYRQLLTIFLSLLVTACFAQLSDEEAILRARSFLSVVAPDVVETPAQVLRDTLRVHDQDLNVAIVYFHESSVALHSNGSLSGLSIRGQALNPKGGSSDKFSSDAEAWQALENVVDKLDLDLPPGLKRSSIERMETTHRDYSILFYKRPSPYGFENSEGNYLAAKLHRITGRVIHISVARGHTYEQPNIRVSEEHAVAKAVAKLGGSAEDYTGRELKYFAAGYDEAPEYLKEMIRNKVMRLMYLITGPRGTAMIDSVTGDLITTLHIDSNKSETLEKKQASAVKPNTKVDKDSGQSSILPTTLAGLVALLSATFVAWKMRNRKV